MINREEMAKVLHELKNAYEQGNEKIGRQNLFEAENLAFLEKSIINKTVHHQFDPRIQYYLGLCYEKGIGLTQDLENAIVWYRLAACLGNANAQCRLGVCWEEGISQSIDMALICYQIDMALKCYQSAAAKNHAEAQYRLGCFYEHGIGVEKNLKESQELYRLAALQGHVGALKRYGTLASVTWNIKPESNSYLSKKDKFKCAKYEKSHSRL
jgi:TPR repeat protein